MRRRQFSIDGKETKEEVSTRYHTKEWREKERDECGRRVNNFGPSQDRENRASQPYCAAPLLSPYLDHHHHLFRSTILNPYATSTKIHGPSLNFSFLSMADILTQIQDELDMVYPPPPLPIHHRLC